MNRTVQKAIRVEYAMLRTPLTVLDEQVLARFAERSKLRTAVELGIDKLDAVAARLLPGSPGPAGPTDTESPDDRSADADSAGTGASSEAPVEIPVEEVEQRAADLLEHQEAEHQLVGELAEDEELRRVQAELKAKHAVEQEHQNHG